MAQAQAAAPSSQPNFTEIGFSGTQVWNGLVRDDYNADLQFPKSISVYERMRRSDAQVQAVETVCALPVRTVRYYIKPPDDGRASKEAADLIESNLLEGFGMEHSFDDLGRQGLIALMTGYQLAEKCFIETGGYIRWRKFAFRHPRTVKHWIMDGTGSVSGFMQYGVDPNGKVRTEEIGPDKLLRFTYREEWGNPEGFPLSRAMYKHWTIVDAVYRAANIGIARELVGTPKGQWPAGASETDKQNFFAMLKDYAVGDQSAMAYGPGYEVEMFGGKANTNAIIAYLKHHYEAMTRAALASFINLAGSGRGSNALSEDQSEFFLLCEEALATWLCEVINVQVIPQLCVWNFPGMTEFPRLEHAHMGTILQPVAIAHGLAALVNKELLTPGADIENAVREMMNLPEIPEDQLKNRPPPEPPAASSSVGAVNDRDAVAVAGAVPATRNLQPATSSDLPVRRVLRDQLDQIRQDLDAGQAEFIAQAKAILDKVVAWAQEQVSRLADEAAGLPPLQRGKVQTALADLELPYSGEYQDWMRGLFMGIVQAGMEQRRANASSTGVSPVSAVPAVAVPAVPALAVGGASCPEAGAVPAVAPVPAVPVTRHLSPVTSLAASDDPIPNELRSYVRALARVTADKHFEDLRFAFVTKAQRDIEGRLGRDAVMFNTRQVLLDQANASLGGPFEDVIRAVTDHVAGVLLLP